MRVDALSASLRALSFMALFQAAGMAIFIALFGRRLERTAEPLRRLGIVSALFAVVLVTAHYALEAARMSGDLAGVMDGALQRFVLQSTASTALALRLAGLVLILIGFVRHTRHGSLLISGRRVRAGPRHLRCYRHPHELLFARVVS